MTRDDRAFKTPGVDSARRALQVLMLFTKDRPALSIEQIARETRIAAPSVYRYIALLRELALVDEHAYGLYALSPRVHALSRAADSVFSLSRLVRPVLEELSAASGEMSQMMRRSGDWAVCSEIVEVATSVRISFTLGELLPLHRGAGAKVLLASMGEEWVRGYLARVGQRLDDDERQKIVAEVPVILSQGWAQSSSEVDEGIWAIAAPVCVGDHVTAAITVAGPRYRIDAEKARRIHRLVVERAQRLSDTLTTASGAPEGSATVC